VTDQRPSGARPRWRSPASGGRADRKQAIGASDRKERLERWAALLERDPHKLLGLLRPSWASGDDLTPLGGNPSAIDLAWDDPVFRVTGLKARSRESFKAFFGLSNTELDRIVSGSWRVPIRSAWQVAGRIRNVADPRPERMLMASVIAMVIVVVGIAQWLR
tara:strand:+ start:1207 stop:1692 length:486 start_codon:yes stop_codon:yes gene_type:complete